ncbi:hypothetical protein CHS0354_027374 [Potamilus streckersoni]|uniref:SPOR domain-containing protein n=1 Tax=Potamilus streckersoni TaxID=2493646 RepID=A0AAE0SQU5_9BIVA|nr:hypothetical protein CHS0354_027374 [Potamilus streckersoni]
MATPAFDPNDANTAGQNFEELFSDSLSNNNAGNEKEANELDSFFEDLTSLDESDLTVPTDLKEEDADRRIISGTVAPSAKKKSKEKAAMAAPMKKKQPADSEKHKKLKRWLLIILLILGCAFIAWRLYHFLPGLFKSSPSELSDGELFKPGESPTISVKPLPKTKATPDDNGRMSVEADPNGNFGVQVAVCVFQTCIDELIIRAKRLKPTYAERYLEMISEGSFTRSEADNYAGEINRFNNIMGHAVLLPYKDDLYKISLGNFFYLEDFKRVKQIIEDNISDPRIIMIDNPKRQRAKTFRVIAGPFASKDSAEAAREDIRQLAGLNAAFVVDTNRF